MEGISSPNHQSPPFLNGESMFLANARSCIALLVKLLNPPRVWIPSYLCSVVIRSVERVAAVKFYEVNYDLAFPSLEWLDTVQPNDLVVLVDYFGFPCDRLCIKGAKEQGAWVLEDACQALLSKDVGRFSDFVVYSPVKFMGVPDGGILSCNREVGCDTVRLENPPVAWWLKAFSASVLRREFDVHGGTRRWFQLFRDTEAEAPVGLYAMSELSRILLQNSVDYSTISRKRAENYEMLASELRELAVFPFLSQGVVPLGFPIRVKNRDRLRQALFDHEIYPPIHWLIEGVVPQEFGDSHRLASEIMTLPCDQRYGRDDMERMLEVVMRESPMGGHFIHEAVKHRVSGGGSQRWRE